MALSLPVHPPKPSSPTSFMDNGKYIRYTNEQVAALERVYSECPKPSASRRQQLIRECPTLQNIEPKQIKVWFQNRRCREKQRKESARLQNVSGKLTAMNKLLLDENDRLQKQVTELLGENAYLRQQLQLQGGVNTADTSCDSAITNGFQHLPMPPQVPHDSAHSSILSLGHKTLTEFLQKATGTAVDWIQMPGMKPGPDSVGMVNISHSCPGVAARACGVVGLEPGRVVEVLKDRPSWQRDCRRLSTLYSTHASDNGKIEVLYMQMYAPTTLAPARDFCILRYSSILEDGSYVICESSLNDSQGIPTPPLMQSFVRAEMLPSGYLIRPCEGTGSIIIVVDHMDLESWSVPEVLRPLYESSAVFAYKTTIAALRYLRHLAEVTPAELPGAVHQPAVRSLSHRLARGFNEAVNSFPDDGWTTIPNDGSDDVSMVIRRENGSYLEGRIGSVLCAKASMLLQNVPPPALVHFLREHRSEWSDHNTAGSPKSVTRISYTGFAGACTEARNSLAHQSPIHSLEKDEFLELIKMEGHAGDSVHFRDIFLLQLCSGLEDNAAGACAEMVFAPVDPSISEEVLLIPSGFCVIPLDNCVSDAGSPTRTLDLASTLDLRSTSSGRYPNENAVLHMRSVLTLAFQFTFEAPMQESVASMARQFVRNVISNVQRVAMALAPSRMSLQLGASSQVTAETSEGSLFAYWICRSYKLHLGVDLVRVVNESSDLYFKALWQHSDAIVCCSCKPIPIFTFANQAGLEMLQTSPLALQEVSWEKTLDENSKRSLCSIFNQVAQQGYACLPAGILVSSLGRVVSYNQGVAWNVLDDEDVVYGVAFTYANWSFV